MGSATSTIVPANRLGQLLAEARLREGTDLQELAARSDFTVGELSDFEAGHRVLNDTIVQTITRLYAIDCGPIIPQRTELTIDLNENVMMAAGHALPLSSAAHDHVLERYLSLVYVLRDSEPGTAVPLRDEDVTILATSLAQKQEFVHEQLLRTMECEGDSVNGLFNWFKQRLWVPGAGAVVGAVSLGTLVMLSSDGTALASEPSDVPEPDVTPGSGPSRLSVARSTATVTSSQIATSTPPTDVTSSTTATTVADSSTVGAATIDLAAPIDSVSDVRTPATMGAAAEALLPFDWQAALPGWTIDYRGPDSEFRGLTYPYAKSIELYVRDDDTAASLAGILAHEIGHAIDVTHLSDGERSQWRETRSIESHQWWPDAYASDFETGAGDFAEAFAYWAVQDPSSSEIAHQPTTSQLAALEALLDGVF